MQEQWPELQDHLHPQLPPTPIGAGRPRCESCSQGCLSSQIRWEPPLSPTWHLLFSLLQLQGCMGPSHPIPVGAAENQGQGGICHWSQEGKREGCGERGGAFLPAFQTQKKKSQLLLQQHHQKGRCNGTTVLFLTTYLLTTAHFPFSKGPLLLP